MGVNGFSFVHSFVFFSFFFFFLKISYLYLSNAENMLVTMCKMVAPSMEERLFCSVS